MASAAIHKLVPRTGQGEEDGVDWLKMAAGGSLLLGGLLIITGNRKAGIAAAATGTALSLIDQQELVKSWWRQVPGYFDQAQRIIGQVQGAVDEMKSKREALRQALNKEG